jgi:hypothetical protein
MSDGRCLIGNFLCTDRFVQELLNADYRDAGWVWGATYSAYYFLDTAC